MIRKIRNIFSKTQSPKKLNRKDLEKRAIEGAKKAVTDYKRVFERLAEYDRA
jgi:hypothetical protein